MVHRMTSTDEPGFVQVSCPDCSNDELWLQCDRCSRRCGFSPLDDGFQCECGARYRFARCGCGAEVPPEHLRPVPFEKGPVSLADLVIDWRKVAVLGAAAAGLLGSGLWLLLG